MLGQLREIVGYAGDFLNVAAAVVAVVLFYLWRPTASRVSAAARRGPLVWLTLAGVLRGITYALEKGCKLPTEKGPGNWCLDYDGYDYRVYFLTGIALAGARTAAVLLAARGFLLLEPLGGENADSAAVGAGRARWLRRLALPRIAVATVGVWGCSAIWLEYLRVPGTWRVSGREVRSFLAYGPMEIMVACALWAFAVSLAWTWSRQRSRLASVTVIGYRVRAIAGVVIAGLWYLVFLEPDDAAAQRELLGLGSASAWLANGVLALATITEYLRRTIDAERDARVAAEAAQLRLEEDARVAEGTFAHLRHTLRNSVGTLAGDLHLLKLRLRRGDLDAAKEGLAEIDRCVARLQTSVIPLLTAGHQSGRVPEGGLPAISLHDTLWRWVSLRGDRSLAVSYTPPPGGTQVRLDPVTLMTVLDRLSENAKSHGRARTLALTVEVRSGLVLLGVANDGAPIPPAVVPTLFADPTHGLGAAFVLLAREGARIALGPADNGVQFWVTMPHDVHAGSGLPDHG